MWGEGLTDGAACCFGWVCCSAGKASARETPCALTSRMRESDLESYHERSEPRKLVQQDLWFPEISDVDLRGTRKQHLQVKPQEHSWLGISEPMGTESREKWGERLQQFFMLFYSLIAASLRLPLDIYFCCVLRLSSYSYQPCLFCLFPTPPPFPPSNHLYTKDI